jgi:hypothetical protein
MKKVYSWGEFEAFAKETGLKFNPKEKKVNEDKREAQRKKFLECKSCHGQRTYLAGTNCLICNCEVEREKEIPVKDKFGKVINKKKEIVKESCGIVDLIAPEYQDYARYLFEDNEN